MTLRAAIAIALTCSASLLAAGQRPPSRPPVTAPSLAERFPPPPGYGVEQDTASDGTRSFFGAIDVKGHILRRFVQADDDTTPDLPAIVRHFADILYAANGVMLDDRFNAGSGRLDGRIPGAKPVWLHVEIGSDGKLIDITALEEATATHRETPLDESAIDGSWSVNDRVTTATAEQRTAAIHARDVSASVITPLLSPYRGWSWRLSVADAPASTATSGAVLPYRMQLSGIARTRTCATCPIVEDASETTALTIDVNRIESLGDHDRDTDASDGFVLDPNIAPTTSVTPLRDGRRVLVTRAGRPPLLQSVTREAYLQARIRHAQSTNDAGLEALRATLAALSAADRTSPAEDALGRRVMRLNPAYVESSRGRAAAHFIVIDVPWKASAAEVSLYMSDLIETVLASPALVGLVK